MLSLFSSWFYTKLFVSDLIFTKSTQAQSSLDDDLNEVLRGVLLTNANKGNVLYLINESLKIAKNREVKIFKTIWLSLFVSFPVWIVGFLIYFLLCIIIDITNVIPADIISANEELVLSFCFFIGLLCAHLVLFPFWQSVKAVTFYQLTDLEKRYSLR